MDLNKIQLIGHLTMPPAMDVGDDGVLRAALRLSVERTGKEKSGETVEDTDYHTVFLYGKLATIAEKYLKEGDRVCVSGVGRYQSFDYISRAGHQRRGLEVVGSDLILLGGRKRQDHTDRSSDDELKGEG